MSFASVVCTARTAARAALTTLLFCAIVRPAWSNVCIALAELLFAIARSAASCARRSAVSSCASTSPRRTRSPSCTCTESTGSASVVVIATFCSGAISPESSVCGETVPYEAVTTGTTAFPVWRGGRCERAHPATISRTQQAASALGTRLQFDAIRPRVPNFERLGSQGIPRFEDRTRPMPMDRRDFTTLLGGSLLASPLAACAPAATEPPPPVEAARPFAESVRAIRAAIARDAADPAILPAGVPRLYEHGAPVQHAVVLYHGFTNCPQQFDELARDYHARGCNVFVPRIPHHGLKDRLTRDLANVTVSELQGFAAETFGLARRRAKARAPRPSSRGRAPGRTSRRRARAVAGEDTAGRSRGPDRAAAAAAPRPAVHRRARVAAAAHHPEHVLVVGHPVEGTHAAGLRVSRLPDARARRAGLSRRARASGSRDT